MEWMSNTRYLKMLSLGKLNGKFTEYWN
jgi:hypothetical protein